LLDIAAGLPILSASWQIQVIRLYGFAAVASRRLLCRDGGVSLIDYTDFCFCFIALILAFTSFCTNAFGIALLAGKLTMAFVVA
jgi:hypothetical protein